MQDSTWRRRCRGRKARLLWRRQKFGASGEGALFEELGFYLYYIVMIKMYKSDLERKDGWWHYRVFGR